MKQHVLFISGLAILGGAAFACSHASSQRTNVPSKTQTTSGQVPGGPQAQPRELNGFGGSSGVGGPSYHNDAMPGATTPGGPSSGMQLSGVDTWNPPVNAGAVAGAKAAGAKDAGTR